MALPVLKQDATLEEIRQWAVEVTESYNTMETDLAQKTVREQQLVDYNNKLFAKVTSKKTEKEVDTEEKEIPNVLDKKTFELLSEKDIEELNELLEGDDE
jgi:hypothetical protein